MTQRKQPSAALPPFVPLTTGFALRSRQITESDADLTPIRAEVFGIERLEEHAHAWAQQDRLLPPTQRGHRLLARLADNERVLLAAQQQFTQVVRQGQPLSSAAEWLLDNFYIVQEQLRQIEQDLSRGYYHALPTVENRHGIGYPRVYGIALELIAHTDSYLDAAVVTRYVKAYQSIAPLTLGELWAVAIMLRLGLIENLRRLVTQSVTSLAKRDAAEAWAKQPHPDLNASLAELAKDEAALDPIFGIHLLQWLRDADPALLPVIHWLESRLNADGHSIEEVLHVEHLRRAANRVSVGNVITSMRTLAMIDWPTFVESTSLVEQVLRVDPLGVYARMDFATRDQYRHAVERISKRARLGQSKAATEQAVAQQALQLAQMEDGSWKLEVGEAKTEGNHDPTSNVQPPTSRLRHVGYYLIGRGRTHLEAAVGYQPTWRERVSRVALAHPMLLYAGLGGLVTTGLLFGPLVYAANLAAAQGGPLAPWTLALIALLIFIPGTAIAVSVVNLTIAVEVQTLPLPKLQFQDELPADCRTMVVVPTLISRVADIERLFDNLEIRYLANRDPHLHFALLGDFADAHEQHRPEDTLLLDTAIHHVEELNARHGVDRFYFFHRQRIWNDGEQAWMGWERKRGKLLEFNRLLRGATNTNYTIQIGDLSILRQVQYVITLDADTELPMNSARNLVGTLAHPLNRPAFDPATQRVLEGYTIIQPRTAITALSAAASRFAQIFAGDTGLDPYATTSSDVYQDLFGAGSYVGKAIYDVDATLAALEGRFPQNVLLSHDLLEGAHARVGLATDIQLLEDFPSGYDAYAQREHRWIRGDWQITDWLFPRVRNESGQRVPNSLPLSERLKILDNLRRSLVPISIVLLLAAGWAVLPGSAAVWTFFALFPFIIPQLITFMSEIGVHPLGETWRAYVSVLQREGLLNLLRACLYVSFILYQAVLSVDAIARVSVRRTLTHRRLLEWNSAAVVERGQAHTLSDYARRMWLSPLLSSLLAVLVWWVAPGALLVAAPLLALWWIAPLLAYSISQPLQTRAASLPAEADRALRLTARNIWRFYETFAGAADHYLPPDNYQEEPMAVVAHRTSPTNIGFLLLATVAAHDFGFIGVGEVVERVERTLATLQELERYNGHCYNWYDTLTLQPLHPRYVSTVDNGNLAASLIVLRQACLEMAEALPPDDPLGARLHTLTQQANTLTEATDFRFLFDGQREIFAVGFNVENHRLDNSFYDLLASEARLTSFIAIALGQVPMRHWFKLGRPLTHTAGRIALLSWGGTMFEYLMPSLWMHTYERTLLHQSCQVVVRRQIEYGKQRNVPWGISESGFNAVDYQQNYQYRMFGVPDLGLKREADDNLVIAPYATFLALSFAPQAAWNNLQRLARAGAVGDYGYYEAVDYTAARRPKGERFGLVRSHMAHHQGMSLCALDNFLNADAMQRRFHRAPIVAATELLLQEKLPRHVPIIEPHPEVGAAITSEPEIPPGVTLPFTTPHTRTPRAHLLSNGAYTVMVTNAGGGYSAYKDMAVTRWQADVTRDAWGAFVYIKDVERDALWSAAHQPTAREAEEYEVVFSLDKVSMRRRDDGIETVSEIAVSPEDNVEVRRIQLTNTTREARELQVTSYAEVALDSAQADAAHPAFSKLFVESEFAPECGALLFKRRPRVADQSPTWALHLLTLSADPEQLAATNTANGSGEFFEYETDRARFLGRGRTPRDADALNQSLSNTVGAVLDPIMSLRRTVRLAAGAQATLSFVTGIADSRAGALRLAETYGDPRAVERVFDLSAAHNQVRLRHLGISAGDAHLFQRLASRVLYPDATLRAAPEVLADNRKGQSGLWAYGISGDHPIVLVKVDDQDELPLVRQALSAHEFWRLHNFTVDLVILNGHAITYGDTLQGTIQNMIDTSLSHPWADKPGGVFLRRADMVTDEDKVLLETVARVVLDGELGTLADHLDRSGRLSPSALIDERQTTEDGGRKTVAKPSSSVLRPPSLFNNGLGGFDPDQREYVIVLDKGQQTPMPWSNVLANENFGCLVSESALGYSWAANSQLNRLTPWSNDPISDPPGEAIYVRDDVTGEVWSPTPLPIREDEPYAIRHGAGYTRFAHRSHDIAQELLVFVPKDEPLKILRLTLRNESKQARTLSVTSYSEWVLGVTRAQSQPFVISERDATLDALFARNTYNTDFKERVAFVAAYAPASRQTNLTADRTEFIGRNGSLQSPAALRHTHLSGQVGVSLDPCAAVQVQVLLQPQQATEVVFLMGQGKDKGEARALIEKYREAGQVAAAFDALRVQWDVLLGTVQVKTPDAAMDLLLNQWLLYQTLACRVWARAAFYQSGGAYGYRDQLQDVMALVYAAPQLTREHILRAAAKQFCEGDVLHWWHPPADAGLRTRFSDDYLWLPYVTAHYVTTTGDSAILDEAIPFLAAPPLPPDQKVMYFQPAHAEEQGTLYDHC
ncbi:MAG: glucoamylase family protein, partial [Chloroflexota bacterium]